MNRLVLFGFVLSLLLSACSGLGGEPEIIATIPAPTDDPNELGYPAQPPDLANGAAIYAARCMDCHGPNGEGDGQLVLSGQVPNPGNFRDPVSAQSQTPFEWFTTITQGRIEALMPPWREALTEQERWDVALYTYTMHYAPSVVEQGQALIANSARLQADYEQLGAGFTDLRTVINYSDIALQRLIVENADGTDPLDQTQRRTLTQYTRTLMLSNVEALASTPAVPPSATPEVGSTAVALAPGETVSGVVTGRVTHGTAGFSMPPDSTVTLHIFDAEFNEERRTATVTADGTFRFEDVPFGEDYGYFASTTYNGRQFASRAVAADPANPTVDLPLSIYELTEDLEAIRVVATVIQIAPSQNLEGLEVVQFIRYENVTDRVFTTSTDIGDGRYLSVVVSLPPGSVVLGLSDVEQRYVVLEEQGVIVDTLPVLPGEDHIIQVAYFVPYSNNSAIIEQPMNYAVDGLVRVLLTSDVLTLRSEQLSNLGPQEVGENVYQGYGGTVTLERPGLLRYEVIGALARPGVITGENLLAFGLIGVGVLILIGAGVYAATRRRPGPDKGRIIDVLIQQLAELDEAHNAGRINHDVYQRQRAELKTRLDRLTASEGETSTTEQ